ncbi:MAG TPA: hypothetical protein V6D28_00610 [Leptolyngbyaceae cyanobacterium]
MNHPPVPVIIILLLVNAIIFWLLFSRSWLSLAKLYKTNQAPPRNIRRMKHGSVGLLRYKGTLNVGITPEGLYLSLIPPLNIGTPPLLIPWQAIDRIENVNSLFGQNYRLRLKNNKITIVLNEKELDGAKLFFTGEWI